MFVSHMIEKNILKKIILEQQELFKGPFVERDKLIKLNEKSSSDLIVIITGIRRCGKSVLLTQFKKNQNESDYYINFDDDRLHTFNLDDFERLYETLIDLFGTQSTFYFDEIQNVVGWELFVRRLNDYNNKIYITGSNANLLSKELGTHLTGRYLTIELFPASFKEYLRFNELTVKENDYYNREKTVLIQKQFKNYVTDGGFFKYLQTNDIDFFKILYDNILYRDIIVRYKLSHEKGIKDIFYYLTSNIAKEFSYTTLKNISNIASITTIKDYISYLENSYLLFTINQYDVSLKKQLINPKKVYIIDTGFANSISFKFSEDYGRLLENIVFLELKRNGLEIYYHRQKKECDFIIKEGLDIIQAIQVTKSLSDINTNKREIDGLIEAMKVHNLKEGLILTDDEENEFIQDGFKIIVKPIWKWLLE